MNRSVFYSALRKSDAVFGTSLGAGQVKGIEGILDAFEKHGDGKADTLAYGLATAYHETARRMVPVREGLASTDAGARRAVNALARKRGPQSAVARYAKPDPVTGQVYYGRGHVQLTWADNYKASSVDAGVDLYRNPDAMLDPVISARVLFAGLLDGRWNGSGKGLRFYLDRGDVTGARRTVNGTDKASTIAEYHRSFLAAIKAAGGVNTGQRDLSPPSPGADQKPLLPATGPEVDLPPVQKPVEAEKTGAGAKTLAALAAAVAASAAYYWHELTNWIGGILP